MAPSHHFFLSPGNLCGRPPTTMKLVIFFSLTCFFFYWVPRHRVSATIGTTGCGVNKCECYLWFAMSSRHCWPHEVLEIAGQPCRCRYQPSEDECHDVSPTKPGNCTRKKENMKFTYSSGLQPIELINIGRNWLAPRKRGIFSMLFSVKCVVILTTFPSTPPPLLLMQA